MIEIKIIEIKCQNNFKQWFRTEKYYQNFRTKLQDIEQFEDIDKMSFITTFVFIMQV